MLVDLPGAYSLAAQSPDEMVAIDVLLGHVTDLPRPKAVLAVVDATNLRRNLFLVTQLAELDVPLVVALNLWDVAESRGIQIDTAELAKELGATVVPVSAGRGTGLEALRTALTDAIKAPARTPLRVLPEVSAAAADLGQRLRASGTHLQDFEVERALIDAQGVAERRFELTAGDEFSTELMKLRSQARRGRSAGRSRSNGPLRPDQCHRRSHRAAGATQGDAR